MADIKITTDDDAREVLNLLGKDQPMKNTRCPRCGDIVKKLDTKSHRANIRIYYRCYAHEWREDHGFFHNKIKLKYWRAIIEIRKTGVWVE